MVIFLPVLLNHVNQVSALNKEKKLIAGQFVTVYEPDTTPSGVTFFVTGAMAPLSIYESMINVILGQNQWVIGVVSNVFFPFEDNHRFRARQIKQVFDAFLETHSDLPDSYSLVGHSAGAKTSLLVTGVYDTPRVTTVIALDPVDQCPPEFTNNETGVPNETLMNSNATIILTQTGVYDQDVVQFNASHNAAVLHQFNPNTIYVHHEGSGHNCYTDLELEDDFIVPLGDPDANAVAKEDAYEMIRQYIG